MAINNPAVFRALLEAGANLNAKDTQGMTPGAASREGHVDAVKLFLHNLDFIGNNLRKELGNSLLMLLKKVNSSSAAVA